MSIVIFRTIDSPVGLLTLAGRDGTLGHLRMVGQTHEPSRAGWERDDDAFPDAVEQLGAYFVGDLTTFDVDLALAGTQFQRRVSAALQTIPLWRDPVLRRDRRTDRCTRCISRGRACQRAQSDWDHRAVSPGDRRQRKPHRLWRRIGA